MQFFPDITPDGHDADPEDVDQPRRPDWTGPPADWWPTAVGTSVLLASSDHVAVGLTAMAVYPTGVALSLRWMLRSRGQGRRDWADLMDRFEGGRFRGQADPARGIRFGLVLADGTPVLSHAEYELPAELDVPAGAGPGDDTGLGEPAAPTGPLLVLAEQGGSGDDRSYATSATLWLWPLPPEGPREIVMTWPEFGIGETRHALPAVDVVTAAEQARSAWDD